MPSSNLFIIIHFFLSYSSILTPEELRRHFSRPVEQQSKEISPAMVCEDRSKFSFKQLENPVKFSYESLPYSNSQSPKDSADGDEKLTSKKSVNEGPAFVLKINKSEPDRQISKELYYWLRAFISSPNDVLVFKSCIIKDGYYLIRTEAVDGDLRGIFTTFRKEFSLKQQLKLFKRMAEELASVHKAGIVHRGINPQNFFIRYTNADDFKLKIWGFSIADEIKSTSLAGAPLYMPPEALQKKNPYNSKNGDIWSLGLTFMNMYTDDVKLSLSCYTIDYTAECYDDLMKNLHAVFSQTFASNIKKFEGIAEAQNIMEVIKAMLTFDPKSRPSPEEVKTKLESLIKSLELI